MSGETVTRPAGRLIAKPIGNLHPPMLVCPAQWRDPHAVGKWATVVSPPYWFRVREPGRTTTERRIDVQYPGKPGPTVLKVPAGVSEVDVVIP